MGNISILEMTSGRGSLLPNSTPIRTASNQLCPRGSVNSSAPGLMLRRQLHPPKITDPGNARVAGHQCWVSSKSPR
mgnify:CR=1 FL=1